MPHAVLLQTSPFPVPAACFNRLRLLQLRAGGPLEFGLPGLPGLRMVVRRHQWQCWSRPLNALLMTWHDFHLGQRNDLGAPVICTLSVHHSYARTCLYRIHASLEEHCGRHCPASGKGSVLRFPSP
ncbi:MAG TPA: hypothetical protein ENJ94_06155 [Gammaproteobacteria bacterium]|nr:hypothetical protein [Gammaproteobacteria bacterium]